MSAICAAAPVKAFSLTAASKKVAVNKVAAPVRSSAFQVWQPVERRSVA